VTDDILTIVLTTRQVAVLDEHRTSLLQPLNAALGYLSAVERRIRSLGSYSGIP